MVAGVREEMPGTCIPACRDFCRSSNSCCFWQNYCLTWKTGSNVAAQHPRGCGVVESSRITGISGYHTVKLSAALSVQFVYPLPSQGRGALSNVQKPSGFKGLRDHSYAWFFYLSDHLLVVFVLFANEKRKGGQIFGKKFEEQTMTNPVKNYRARTPNNQPNPIDVFIGGRIGRNNLSAGTKIWKRQQSRVRQPSVDDQPGAAGSGQPVFWRHKRQDRTFFGQNHFRQRRSRLLSAG